MMTATEPIIFTPAEVRTYYLSRVPNLKTTSQREWRAPCPIHHGKGLNFAVESGTGQWFCHSQCGCGGDILELEMSLTGADFKTAKAEVFNIVGRYGTGRNGNANRHAAAAAPAKPKPTKSSSSAADWQEIARYPYPDQDGSLLYEVVRIQPPTGNRIFLPERASGIEALGTTDPEREVPTGGIVVGLNADEYVRDIKRERVTGRPTWRKRREGDKEPIYHFRECPRVPYRLPQLLANKERIVFLPEGEKDVHTLEGWKLLASCNPGGAGGSGLYSLWTEYFRDRKIIIPIDNDESGRRHALEKAEILLGVAKSVRIVELPGLLEKGDITDWKDAGGTFEQFCDIVSEISPLDAAALQELRARWGLVEEEHGASRHHEDSSAPENSCDAEEEPYQVHAEAADDWPKPEPMQDELPPVEAFSEDLLPDSFRPLVADVAERMQVPMDFPAVVIVLCLAGAVNRRAIMQPLANDTSFTTPPNLWGAIVAEPGLKKSPLIHAVIRPLEQIQAEWWHEHIAALKDYKAEKEKCELRRAAWREQYKAAVKKSHALADRPEDEPAEPTLRRLIVNDSTVEKLHETLAANPAGVLFIRDELTGLLSRLDQDEFGTERAFYLSAWNGDTPHTTDRIVRGTIHVPHCCLSMLGSIQPGRLRPYLADALKDGPGNDGLIQRFQLVAWPDKPTDWRLVDRKPNAAYGETVSRVFRQLVRLDCDNPLRARFDPEAQQLFNVWLTELEKKLLAGWLHPAMVSHLSKYRSLMPSLALLFELADRAAEGSVSFGGSTPGESQNFLVSIDHTRQAAAWCDYLESHARRVYSCIVTPQVRAARELANHIRLKHVTNKDGGCDWFTSRDVYRKGWAGLDSPEAVRRAVELLQDAGWLRELPGESVPLGGRPSSQWSVNPGVRQ